MTQRRQRPAPRPRRADDGPAWSTCAPGQGTVHPLVDRLAVRPLGVHTYVRWCLLLAEKAKRPCTVVYCCTSRALPLLEFI
jgi:hypothetical protein